jgi:hypothetical protein
MCTKKLTVWRGVQADALRACECGPDAQIEPHTCPFAEEINNDSDTLCTCCETCKCGCAQDI